MPEAAPGAEPPPRTKLDTSKLEALFTKATNDYDTGKWDDAITGFRELYGLMPDPSFLFNIGQAYRQKGACRDATAAYKSYLRNASDANRPRVEQYVKELEPCVKIEEENARRLLPPPPPPPPPPVGPRLAKWGGIAMTGTGVLLVGAAVGFSLRARGAQRDLIAECADGCTGSEVEPFDRKGRDSDRAAKLLYIVGGAMVVTGSTLVVFALTRSERVTVRPTATGAVVLMGGRF